MALQAPALLANRKGPSRVTHVAVKHTQTGGIKNKAKRRTKMKYFAVKGLRAETLNAQQEKELASERNDND